MPMVDPFDRCFETERNQQANADRRDVNQKILPRSGCLVWSPRLRLARLARHLLDAGMTLRKKLAPWG